MEAGPSLHADPPASTDGESRNPSNVFVAVEGCNGSGKSTVAAYLAGLLGARLFHFPPDFVRFKEESRLDIRVRAVPRFVYYLAAALELSDLVRGSLGNSNVVCDRYFPSSMVSVVAFDHMSERYLSEMARPFVDHILRPDLVLLLKVMPSVAVDRISRRARILGELTTLSKHLIANPETFAACEELLRNQAAQLAPVVEIDTTHLTVDRACSAAAAAVETVGIQEWTGAVTRR